MSPQGWIALATLVGAAILFSRRWIPLQVTALAIPIVLVVTHVLPRPIDALAGFTNPAVITIASIFVVGAGLQESGVTTLVARAIQRLGGRSEAGLVAAVTLVAAGISAIASTAAVVAIFMPAVMSISRRAQVSPSRLLLPLAFGATMGCNLLLLSSVPNMLVAQQAEAHGGALGMFGFARVGLPLLLAGTLALVLLRKRLLPARSEQERLRKALHPEAVALHYGLPTTMFRMRVIPQSSVTGRTIAEAGIRARYGLDVVAVSRPRTMRNQFLDPRPDLVLASGDELYLEGDDEAAWRFADSEMVQYGLAGPSEIERILGRGMTVAEVALPPRSTAIGKTLKDLGFRARFGLNVLALWRRGGVVRDDVGQTPLELGDAFLVSGKASRVQNLARDPDWLVISEHASHEDVSRAPLALLLLAVAIVPAMAGWLPPSVSAMAAAVLMVATRCLSVEEAERALDWRVLFLIIGTLPLGTALRDTGVASVAAGGLVGTLQPFGHAAILAGLFVLAMAVSLATTNGTAANIVAPVAVTVATAAGLSLPQVLLAVASGCNTTFLLPYNAANLQVMVPGGYTPRDYLRAGGVMTLVAGIVTIAILAWIR